jgi:predicted DNA-binding transcriptional regulator YafY
MSQFHRLVYIDRMIKEFGVVSKKQVVDEFQVSHETVKGDFRYMKYEVQSPIVYSRLKKGYYYKKKFDLFSFADEKMFLLFVLVNQLARNRKLVPVIPEGLIKAIEEQVDPEYLKLSGHVTYEMSEYELPDMNKFETVIKAMQMRNALDIEYDDAKGKFSKRKIEPLHIFNYQGKWTLYAYCRQKKEERMFSLSRIKTLKTDESEKIDVARFDDSYFQDRLSEGFGIARGKEIETAVIHFYEPTLHHVSGQIWHSDQKTDEIDINGRKVLRFILPVAKYEELAGRVLRFSPDAEIVSPPALRQMWIDKLKESVKRYT